MGNDLRRWITLCEAMLPEHWETVEIFGVPTLVGWQITKDQANRQAHDGLSLRAGIVVIDNPVSKTGLQQLTGQERDAIVGPGEHDRILVVVVEWLDPDEDVQIPAVRMISVRYAKPSEIREYQMNEDQHYDEPIDPDNPPLKPGIKLVPWRDVFLKRVAEFKAKKAKRDQEHSVQQNTDL